MGKILVVDDESSMRDFFEILLKKQGYEVLLASSGPMALDLIHKNSVDLVITDLKMPQMSGIELLSSIKDLFPHIEVLVVTAYSTVETAISAMKLGAFNYLSKPFNNDEIILIIQKAIEKVALIHENRRLQDALQHGGAFSKMVGSSQIMRELFSQIRQVASKKTTVIISGESGTGKELVARALHQSSPRASGPFVVVNCGAIPENLMESELFGHVKGSFTGAHSDKKGLASIAHTGTLFLDEVGELPSAMQVKILRLLQERTIKPVGAVKEHDVDIRVIAATNRDLEVEVREGRFREDLFFRLNVIHLLLPPLRERMEDIPLLARFFLERYSEELERDIKGFEKEAMHLLMSYNFPGNVRELENIVERAVAFELGDWISPQSLPPRLLRILEGKPGRSDSVEIGGFSTEYNLEDYLERIEKHHIEAAIKLTGGSVTKAAEKLGLSFRSMRYKLSKYDIER